MSNEEFKFLDKNIALEKRDEISSSFKINAYKTKLKFMNAKKIPQKDIENVLNHFFNKNRIISEKTKKSISKITYSKEDKIIIVITHSGKDIILNRDKLIKEYGWFFFITKSEKEDKGTKKKKQKKKTESKAEKTVSSEILPYEDSEITLKQKENMRALYRTKEYNHYMKMIKSKEVPQIPIKEVLDDFFQKDKLVPLEEKKGIKKIIYYQKEKVVVIKSLIGDKMYENLERLVKKYGWYFYITGVPVGDSDLCIAIDKINKRFNENYFTNISLVGEEGNSKDIRVTIYPIVLKPNHNCHILGMGKLNILLDCGLSSEKPKVEQEEIEAGQEVQEKNRSHGEEEKETNDNEGYKGDMKHIDDYLQNLPQFITEEERRRIDKSVEVPDELILNDLPQNPKIDAIFISHSHWDHISGLKELIKMYPDIPILSSRITLDLFLLRDSKFLKQEKHDEIEEEIYQNIVKNVIYVENGTKLEFEEKNCFLSFFHAGHMPGALMMLAKVNDFRLLYTGDYTYHDITPFAGTRRFLEQISRPINYLLIDGTAAQEDFG
ncbi:MAG: MBL fold metallo-hydrolase, partial [Promethearchaeota archaeon]